MIEPQEIPVEQCPAAVCEYPLLPEPDVNAGEVGL